MYKLHSSALNCRHGEKEGESGLTRERCVYLSHHHGGTLYDDK